MNPKELLAELRKYSADFLATGRLQEQNAIEKAIAIVKEQSADIWQSPNNPPAKTGNYLYDDGEKVGWCYYSRQANSFFILLGERFVTIEPLAWRKMPCRSGFSKKTD